jgi:hypothetical protein
MRTANSVRTSTHTLTVATSDADGHMYLLLQGVDGLYRMKLTEENRDALKTVLGPTDTWKGIL